MFDDDSGAIKTSITGLDDRMEGGIPRGHIVLLCGPSGSLKTTLAFSILYHYVKDKKGKAGYISFEQNSASIMKQMKKFNMDVEPFKNEFPVIDLSWLRKALKEGKKEEGGQEAIDWFFATERQIKSYKEFIGYDVLAIDSLEALCSISDVGNPRTKLFHFFETLRDLKITTIIISEMQPDSQKFGEYGVEGFLADGIVHLAMERMGRSVGRFIRIVKMREVGHPTDYFPLIADKDGFRIVTK